MFRSTIVHRFLIKATIEERMQTMLKTVDRRYVLNFFKHCYCNETEKEVLSHTSVTIRYTYQKKKKNHPFALLQILLVETKLFNVKKLSFILIPVTGRFKVF